MVDNAAPYQEMKDQEQPNETKNLDLCSELTNAIFNGLDLVSRLSQLDLRDLAIQYYFGIIILILVAGVAASMPTEIMCPLSD